MTIMMMIMTDPFATNLVVKGPVVKGSVVKGATSIITIIMIILILKQMTAVWTTSASWAVRTERGGSARKLSTGN